MARMLYNPPNFLVLDEPVNHFERTMICVSHDRMFLCGPGSRVLKREGKSGADRHPRVCPGSYIEYVQTIGHEAPGIDA